MVCKKCTDAADLKAQIMAVRELLPDDLETLQGLHCNEANCDCQHRVKGKGNANRS
jgi:hypothetical protein